MWSKGLPKDVVYLQFRFQCSLMTRISAFHSPSVRIHLGNWGVLGVW